jgi:hypothetical protein
MMKKMFSKPNENRNVRIFYNVSIIFLFRMCEYISLRLDRGQDLRKEILKLVKQHNIEAGFIASAVGCLQKLNIR